MSTEITIEDKRSAMMVSEAPQPPASLMTVIGNLAANPNVDVDKIRQLLEIQERWQMNVAKSEFREAMAKFTSNPPKIIKDRHVKFNTSKGVTEYDHATLGNVTQQIAGGLGAVGITSSFRVKQEGRAITVTCVLSRGAYSEETSLTADNDDSGGKNPVQSIGSALTYLRRYTLLAATGLATDEEDTDGVTPQIVQLMPDPELLEWVDGINQSPDDKELARLVGAAREAAAKYDCQVAYLAIDKAAILASHSLKTLLQVFPKMYAKWEGKQNFKAARELGEAFEKRKAELEAAQ